MRTTWLLVLVGCGSQTAEEPPNPDAPVKVAVEELAVGLDAPSALALDGTHVYIAHGHNGNELSRVAKAGGTVTPITSGQRGPTSLDASTDRLCWVSTGTHAQDFRDGSIRCAPKTGGGDAMLATSYFPSSLAIHDTTVFWTEIDGMRVRTVELDGSNPQILDESETSKTGIAISASRLAWTASGQGADVVAVDRSSGTMTTISADEYATSTIRIAGDDVFWLARYSLSDNGAVRVWRGGAITNIVDDEYYPSGLAVVNGAVYWTSNGRIRGFVDGQVQTLAADRGTIGGFAADDTHFYWTEPDRGAIVRLRR